MAKFIKKPFHTKSGYFIYIPKYIAEFLSMDEETYYEIDMKRLPKRTF